MMDIGAHPDVFFPRDLIPSDPIASDRIPPDDVRNDVTAPPLSHHRVFATLAVAVALHALLLAFETDFTRSVEPARALAVQLTAALRPSVLPTPDSPRPREQTSLTPTPATERAAAPAFEDSLANSPPTEPVQALAEPAATAATAAEPALVEARVDTAYLDNPKPVYPPMSRRLGEEGTVLLRVDVGASGAVSHVALERSCGYPRLDEAARRAVTGWRFLAARRGDTGVASTVLVPVTFALGGRKA